MKNPNLKTGHTASAREDFSDRLDRLLCRPALGLPFFFFVMSAVFYLSFSGLGEFLSIGTERFLLRTGGGAERALRAFGVADWFIRYLIDGVYRAVASTVAFLPQTAIFFFLLEGLRDCGYLARAVFVADRFFRSFGLSGNAVIPLAVSCGCAVPTVTDPSVEREERERLIRAVPFVPCSARLPVLLYLTDAFFPKSRTLLCVFFLCLVFVLVFLSFAASRTEECAAVDLIVCLPRYRAPRLRVLACEVLQKCREYLIRAGTVVLFCAAVFSALAFLTPSLRIAESGRESLLYALSERIAPVFRPLGFGKGETAAALLLGFFAKENIVYGLGLFSDCDLVALLPPPSALSFTAFAMFYAPCVSLFWAVKREYGFSRALVLLLRTFFAAYLTSLVLYTLSYIVFFSW